MSSCETTSSEQGYLLTFNVVALLCCIGVVAFGRLSRPSRIREPEYVPGPFVPIEERRDSDSKAGAAKSSATPPSKSKTNTKAANKRK
tara:strand:+ start:313 stop:576 length:264 start_codon:yes stop_codon:yes gene_type:complete